MERGDGGRGWRRQESDGGRASDMTLGARVDLASALTLPADQLGPAVVEVGVIRRGRAGSTGGEPLR